MVALRLTRLAKRRRVEFPVDFTEGLAVLPRNPDTSLEGQIGQYSLRFYEKHSFKLLRAFGLVDYRNLGHATIGSIVGTGTNDTVLRKVVSVESGTLANARGGWLSGWLGTAPRDFSDDIEIVKIESTDGWQLSSWFLPAKNTAARSEYSTWVIHVHGRGATPAETARNFAQFTSLGFSNLSISFRNDGLATNGGQAKRGPLALGTTEWQDLEASVKFALKHGASRVLVFAWSYGAAVTLQFQRCSELATKVCGFIFDSPVISWRQTLAYQVALAGRPGHWVNLGENFLRDSRRAKSIGLPHSIEFEDFETSNIARHVRAPMLILHSSDDGYIPIEPSRELQASLPNLVRLKEFQNARHCKLYNFDTVGYQKAITDFVDEIGV